MCHRRARSSLVGTAPRLEGMGSEKAAFGNVDRVHRGGWSQIESVSACWNTMLRAIDEVLGYY